MRRPRSTPLPTAMLCGAALVLAGCSAGDEADSASTPDAEEPADAAAPTDDEPTEEAEPTGEAEPTDAEPTDDSGEGDDGGSDGAAVTIAGFAFGPDPIEVSAGTTITWTNEDSTSHTASVLDGGPSTGSIAGGESATLTFDEAGTFDYQCDFHPGSMTGTIVVQ